MNQGVGRRETTYAMKIVVGTVGHVKVEHHVDLGNINTTSKEIGGHKNSLAEFLDLIKASNTLLLIETTMNNGGGEVAINKNLAKIISTLNRLGEDHDLVEFNRVEDIENLLKLLVLRQTNIELLQTVESQLGIVSHKDLQRLRERTKCEFT